MRVRHEGRSEESECDAEFDHGFTVLGTRSFYLLARMFGPRLIESVSGLPRPPHERGGFLGEYPQLRPGTFR